MRDTTRYPSKSRGFTLIELMISLVLGLLITAAVIQIYISMVRTNTLQKSGSEVTEVSVFTIQQIEETLRIANLGNPVTKIDSNTPYGGIVLTRTNLNRAETDTTINQALLTNSTGDTVGTGNAWTGKTQTNIGSDQLTLQYQNITGETTTDCEGTSVAVNDRVIQRYFLRTGTNGLTLACDAGRVDAAGGIDSSFPAADNRTFGDKGSELIPNVDQFKVLLGVQKNGKLTYMSPQKYRSLTTTTTYKDSVTTDETTNKLAIVQVRLGLLVRSVQPIVNGQPTPTTYRILGVDNTLSTSAGSYVRKVYETNTLLRNARVMIF